MAATASYSAVPSMLMVAPTGRTKRAICRSTWQFSNRHFMVIGSVAELQREQVEIKLRTPSTRPQPGPFQTLTWRRLPGQWPWPAAAHGCTRRGSSGSGPSRREGGEWARGRRDQREQWRRTSPASFPECWGLACPRSSLPPGRRSRRGSTWDQHNQVINLALS